MESLKTLIFEPLLPPPLLAAFWALALLACLAYVFWRPTRLGWFRRLGLGLAHLVPIAGLLLILHGPSWLEWRSAEARRPVLGVWVDQSASMSAEDGDRESTRYRTAVAHVQGNLATLRRDFEVRLYGFDVEGRDLSPRTLQDAQPKGAETNLAGAVLQGLGETPRPSALLVLSDGIHNHPDADLGAAARAARAAMTPVFTVPLGSALQAKDLGLLLSASEELAFVKQQVRIPVTVTQVGYEGQTVEVALRDGGQPVERRRVTFAPGQSTALVEFSASREKAGLYALEVLLEPREEEAFKTNNRRRFALRVVDERVRILLLEGRPYWDSKFLARVLNRDPNVLLTTATRMRPDRMILEPHAAEKELGEQKHPAGTSGQTPRDSSYRPPTQPLKLLEDRRFLAQFQVILLGRDTDAFLTEAASAVLRDWVSAAGCLVCTRGRPVSGTSLQPGVATMLPVAWESGQERRFRVALTERGRAMALFQAQAEGDLKKLEDQPDVVLRALPSLVTATLVSQERALAVVLARGQASAATPTGPLAVLSMQRYGSGRTVVLEGQGLWRWAFRPPDDALKGEDLFRAFWANTVRWLAGSNDFLPSQVETLRPGKPVYSANETAVLYVMRREAAAAPAAHPGAEPAPTGTPAWPVLEVQREDDSGGLDQAFHKLRLTARPMPSDGQVFRAEAAGLPEGHYRARLVDTPKLVETTFELLPPMRERLDLQARPEVLRELAEQTEARALAPGEIGSLGKTYRSFLKERLRGEEKISPAWDEAWVWGTLVGWLALLWFVRRKWGAI